jgi:hypothetical protein
MTQALSLPKVKPKQIFYIGRDQLTPSMAIVLSIHALHLGRVVNIRMDGRKFKENVPIESNWQKLDFLQRDIVIIQRLELIGGLS